MEEEEENEDFDAYQDILKTEKYSIDDDIDEVDEYFASLESPEEDDSEENEPEYSVNHGYFIDLDEYETSKPGYEKLILEYDSASESFFDKASGDDFTPELTKSGLNIVDVLHKFNEEERLYWRVDGPQTDYEILLGDE